jgi:hypothetical protein
MDKIVFINQWASHLTKDIINAFAEKYDKVALIAGTISETGNPLHKKVKINRIIKYNKTSIFSRQVTWILATIQTIILVNLKFRTYHLFITSNPPTLAFITLFCHNKYSIQILDVYPDALIAGGFLSQKSLINKIWRKRNKAFFSDAENVFTITPGMARTISQYCTFEKIKVISQWAPSIEFSNIERNKNSFIKLHSLEKFFIVMYSGNIGLGHHVATLVETARNLIDYKEIIFVIIGEGWNKPVIEKLVNKYNLKNCILLPFQSPDMFKHSSQAADIGVVSVSKEIASLCVPIKTYNLINNNIPLLCITEGESELASLVSKYDIGKCFAPNQINEISNFIISLKTEDEIAFGFKQNLKKCAKDFTPANAILYLDHFALK